MSRKNKNTAKNQERQHEHEKEKVRMAKENAAREEAARKAKISPDAPATEKQRQLLRRAIQKNWLDPNPFVEGNHRKWETLTANEADKLLASIPPERLGILEKELNEKEHSPRKGIGRATEEIIGMIGRSIDGGIG